MIPCFFLLIYGDVLLSIFKVLTSSTSAKSVLYFSATLALLDSISSIFSNYAIPRAQLISSKR